MSLWSALAVSAIAGCGSSKPKAAEQKAEPLELASRGAPSDFCERFTRMYCTNDYEPEPGKMQQTSFEELPAENREALRAECEAAWAQADEQGQETMEQCLGCLADCSVADRCLGAVSSGCPDLGDDPPPSDE